MQLTGQGRRASCGIIVAPSTDQSMRSTNERTQTARPRGTIPEPAPRSALGIYALCKAGHNQTGIAEQLGRHKSTISRELRRNRGLRGYRPAQAQKLADNRKQEKARPRISDEVWQWLDLLIAEEWSPEQISGWLLSEALGSISPEWIYQYVYTDKRNGGDLHRHLRCQKARKKRYGSYDRRGQ